MNRLMQYEIDRAIHDAEHPVGMSIHDGVARIRADTLRRLVAQRDALLEALTKIAGYDLPDETAIVEVARAAIAAVEEGK